MGDAAIAARGVLDGTLPSEQDAAYRIQDAGYGVQGERTAEGTLLDTMDSPADLKKLTLSQLAQLAEELRERITTVVSQTGGHLAPSLGVVELTLALHYVFELPRDKVIWDVGHQSYAHKLLTGRRTVFHTLRQRGGISGFTKRSESPYDAFGAGHASTSISAALGIACARDQAGEDYKVVAVIGDGAMTGGLAFEGMNNAGALGRDLIVVLNDNKMCISPSVGALSRYFTDVIATQAYNRLKEDIWDLTGYLSSFGGHIRRLVRRIDQSVKSLIVPGMWFEKLGFRYFGPIDGHDHAHLINVFRQVRDLRGPIMVHVYTTKGKGFKLAEEDATRFHGVGAFEKMTGALKAPKKGLSYSEVFGRSLTELAERQPKVVAITAAMADGTGLEFFRERFPDRFFDVGIAEGHAVTFAAGLAAEGARPVVAIYSTFLQRGFDHIIHDVALQRLPVVFALDRGGLVGDDGPTHHGAFDLSYLRSIPHLVVMAPKDEQELKAMVHTALDYEEGPIVFRYPRGGGPGVSFEGPVDSIPIGQGEVLREGEDVGILAIGAMVYPAIEAAELLEQRGVSVYLANARFVKPIDGALIRSMTQKTRCMVTVEENALAGGFGSAVLEWLEQEGLWDVRVRRMGVPDGFIEQGERDTLLRDLGLDARGMVAAVERFLDRR